MLSLRVSRRLATARTWQDVRSSTLRPLNARCTSIKSRYKKGESPGSAQDNSDISRDGSCSDERADSSTCTGSKAGTNVGKQDHLNSIFSHASGGPLGGILDTTKELQQRFQNTPGATFSERLTRWFDERSSEYAADTGMTWPSARATKLWKFFFKANRGTTDRYGFAIKMGPIDNRSAAARAEARERSAASLVNIDPQERRRRVTLGAALVVGSAAAAAALLYSWDVLSHESSLRTLIKAGLFGPFAFGMLQLGSGVLGL